MTKQTALQSHLINSDAIHMFVKVNVPKSLSTSNA